MRTFIENMLNRVGQRHVSGMDAKLVSPSVKSEFVKWCVPQRGRSNPEDQTNPVWTWLVETKLSPDAAHEAAGSGWRRQPGWCFQRFGQSTTLLDDGTCIFIGGEHEDFYDVDFFIYNDVIVTGADGSISIYGYPEEILQPTDFHTATKVENGIYIIGGLGYAKDRRAGDTPVYFLDLASYQISKVQVEGDAPSWLSSHKARYEAETHSIILEGGRIIRASANDFVQNESEWQLLLNTLEWKKL